MIRRTLDDIRARARVELNINPTITVYGFAPCHEDPTVGHEINRRPANPWAGLNAALRGVTVSFNDMAATLARAATKFAKFNEGVEKGRHK